MKLYSMTVLDTAIEAKGVTAFEKNIDGSWIAYTLQDDIGRRRVWYGNTLVGLMQNVAEKDGAWE